MKREIVGCAICLFLLFGTSRAAIINEFQPNPPGQDPDNVSFELFGTANSAFDLWVLSIESDAGNGGPGGLIDRASNITGSFDANGLAVATIGDLENPSFTVVLTTDFTGTVGDSDVDTNDDGIIDTTFWTTVEDAIGVPDEVNDQSFVYGSQLGGADFTATGTEPELIFRDGVTQEWFAINPGASTALRLDGSELAFSAFNMDPSMTTFGLANATAIPEPSSVIALMAICSGLAVRRRRRG